MTTTDVYVACALSEALRANNLADCLEGIQDVKVCSRWHAEFASKTQKIDPTDSRSRFIVLMSNIEDIEDCHILVADTRHGNPCATYSEIGYALALEKRIVWIQPEPEPPSIGFGPRGLTVIGVRRKNIFDAHYRVKIVHNVSDALEYVRQFRKLFPGNNHDTMRSIESGNSARNDDK